MNAAELFAALSLIPPRDRRFVQVVVSRAKDDGLSIGSPASDRDSWYYPVIAIDRPNEMRLSLRWRAEDR